MASMASASAAVAARMPSSSDKCDVRRVFLLHADGVIASVDMVRFTRHARRQIAQQVKRRATHVVDRDVAAQRGIMLVPFQDQAEVADPRRGERLDRSSRNRIPANPLRAEIIGERFGASFERRFGDPPDVIMRDDLFGCLLYTSRCV